MRIVIVEDEKKIREGMAGMISHQTDHVVVGDAANGEDGLELICRTRPELVITDIRMPVMDGLEMIRRLKEREISCHVIVLSGYSEFSYAKKAIAYGVDEYLLKPLTASDIQEALKKIEDKLEQEILMLKGTPESCLREIIGGGAAHGLWQVFGFEKEMQYMLMAGYLGSMPRDYTDEVQKHFLNIEQQFPGTRVYSFYQANSRVFYALIAGKGELKECRERIYKKLLRSWEGQKEHPLWAYREFEGEEQIRTCAESLKDLLDYGITAPKFPGWYTREWADSIEWEEFQPPSQLVQRLKAAICQEHMEEADQELQAFLQYFEDHRFRKEEIRQSFLKNYFMILDLLLDLDKRRHQRLRNYNPERMLGEAMTWEELKGIYGNIREVLKQENTKRQDISNYIILKVIQYVRDHYKEKIVLEQVAEQMGVTPEYLSTLFNREVKENFSVFLKRFRISHAKRLLAGTQLKIYEVAQEVGYSDAKYFTRVFKEEEGISPGDYREMQQ